MSLIYQSKYSTKSPKYSLLIPSYNRPQFLKKTIESIIESAYIDFELIISDDHSPTIERIKAIIASYHYVFNLKLFYQEINLGPADNKNFLVNEATGKFVVIMGDDDLISKDLFNLLDRQIDLDPLKTIVYAFGYKVIDENDLVVSEFKANRTILFSQDTSKNIRILFDGNILPFWFFHPFTVCIERNLKLKFPYLKDVNFGYDYLFLYECINAGAQVKVIPEIGFSWRKAQGKGNYQNLSNTKLSDIKSRIGIYKLFFLRNDLSERVQKVIPPNHFENFVGISVLNHLENVNIAVEIIENSLDKSHADRIRHFLKSNSKWYSKYLFSIRKIVHGFNIVHFYIFHFIVRIMIDRKIYAIKANKIANIQE